MPFKITILACWLIFPAGSLFAAEESPAAVLELSGGGLVLKLAGRESLRFENLSELLALDPVLMKVPLDPVERFVGNPHPLVVAFEP